MTTNKERILVVSDIHSNIVALEAVLDDAYQHGPFVTRLCAGDFVGYGPRPNEVVELTRRAGFLGVRGNHDRAVAGGDYSDFNWKAKYAVEHNQRILTEKNMSFIKSLKNTPYIDPQDRFALVHGSFNGSVNGKSTKRFEDIYIEHQLDFPEAPSGQNGRPIPLGIVGHTHIPSYGCLRSIKEKGKKARFQPEFEQHNFPRDQESVVDLETRVVKFEISPDLPFVLVNFGSVGQPRHGSRAACYGVIELEGPKITLEFRNVEYDVGSVVREMQRNELEDVMNVRLYRGR